MRIDKKNLSDQAGRMGDRSRIAAFQILGRLCDVSAVYVAFDEVHQRRVALRVVDDGHHLDEKDREELLQRSKKLAGLENSAFCEVLDYLETDEEHYLVLEPLSGRSLNQEMSNGLDRVRALGFAGQICASIAAAHNAGIVHRELRPESFWVTDEDMVKVFDYGLIRDGRKADDPGDLAGRLGVDPTEQIGGEIFDARRTLDLGSNPLLGVALATRIDGVSDVDVDEGETFDLGSSEQLAAAIVGFRNAKKASRQAECQAAKLASSSGGGQERCDFAYTSPERAMGSSSAAPGDLYAFGLILQEMVSGKPARDLSGGAKDWAERAKRGDRRDFVDSSPQLVDLVSRLCASGPEERPTAAEALDALRSLTTRD
jgi:serine/threonine protein kinase